MEGSKESIKEKWNGPGCAKKSPISIKLILRLHRIVLLEVSGFIVVLFSWREVVLGGLFVEVFLYHEGWIPLEDYEALLNHHLGFILAMRPGLASIFCHRNCYSGI